MYRTAEQTVQFVQTGEDKWCSSFLNFIFFRAQGLTILVQIYFIYRIVREEIASSRTPVCWKIDKPVNLSDWLQRDTVANSKATTPLLLLLLKPAAQAQVKKKIVHKFLSQPHKHLRHVNLKNKLRDATKDWLLPTHLTFRWQTESTEGHSTHESGPAGNTMQFGTFYTLKLQTLMDELQQQHEYVDL